MAFTLPKFVNTYNLWRPPAAPPDAPDFTAQECQFYFTPKGNYAFVAEDTTATFPPIYLRVPKGTDLQAGDIVEVNDGQAFFYTVRWVERVHLDFPNEYLVGLLEQGISTPPPGTGSILLESGDNVLVEDGGLALLE